MNTSDLNLKRILITEDHHLLRKMLRDWLAKQLPFIEVLQASKGEEAVTLCKSRSLDLVLLDFHLPDMNGIEVTEQIKTLTPTLPVVILTFQNDGYYKDKAIDAGVDAYVIKDRMYTDLIPAIEELLPSKVRA
jgi:DNA-binding NarL/FixJ family response regulator